tara:strand:- start:971 stop:1420 length:450 start_codon:yes stop_codon:yes gene_type:complete
MAKKKTGKKKSAPYKEVTTGQEQPAKKGLLEELEELKSKGETSTARYQEVLQEVEVIYGTGETNNFGTNDLNILKGKLSRMTKADLQSFARKVGINPYYQPNALKDNIIKEFHRHQSRGNRFTQPQEKPAFELDPNNPEHKELMDWLNS